MKSVVSRFVHCKFAILPKNRFLLSSWFWIFRRKLLFQGSYLVKHLWTVASITASIYYSQKNVWNLFKVNNKDTWRTSLTSFCCLFCYLWINFTHCSSVSIIDFEPINTGWDVIEHHVDTVCRDVFRTQ